MTITRKGGNGIKNVHRYEGTQDGFRAWKYILKYCDNEGSDTLHMTKLKEVIRAPYTNKYHGGLVPYIDKFQAAIEELGSLDKMYSENKRTFLLDALITARKECSTYLNHIEVFNLDFVDACTYLREKYLVEDIYDRKESKSRVNMINRNR